MQETGEIKGAMLTMVSGSMVTYLTPPLVSSFIVDSSFQPH